MEPDQLEKQLLPFLKSNARLDLKSITILNILGLTGAEEGRELLFKCPQIVEAIVELTKDPDIPLAKDAIKTVTNLATHFELANQLVTQHSDLVLLLLKHVVDKNSKLAHVSCMALCNLTRTERSSLPVVKVIEENQEAVGFHLIVQALCQENYNESAPLKYLGPFLCNLSQCVEARKFILDKERVVIQKLLPFTQYQKSLMKRGGIAGVVRNCCFETGHHEWLLSEDIDILPHLLLPLAGPEEFDDDDMERLPPDLQYLEPDKAREEDPDIRKMLVETLYLLCAMVSGRDYLKQKNVYVILREMDRAETDPHVKHSLEMLIGVLIQDEPGKGFENLKDVAIPEDLWGRFNKEDEEDTKALEEEAKALAEQQESQDSKQQQEVSQGQGDGES